MKIRLSENITVRELLYRHPHLLSTFIGLKLKCVGCPADAFHTMADVAREYGLGRDQLISRLQAAIDKIQADEIR